MIIIAETSSKLPVSHVHPAISNGNTLPKPGKVFIF
jgi:hypothetical protein